MRVRAVLVALPVLVLASAALWLAQLGRSRGEPRPATPAAADGRASPALTAAPPGPPVEPGAAPATPREAVPVAPQSAADELAAETGLVLSGTVTDDLGSPLDEFTVTANLAGTEPSYREEGGRSRVFHAAGGAFRLAGFEPGEWSVWGSSEGHVRSGQVRATLPGAGPIALVLPRACLVSGRVLDPSGAPVAGAEVRVRQRSGFFTTIERTTELGQFRIDWLGPGIATLAAFVPGWAQSASVELELSAGERVEELTLWLRTGVTVLGELVGPDGLAQAGQPVWIGDGESYGTDARTDELGRFEARDLPAGTLSVTAQTREGVHLRERVEVRAGETIRVRLAAPGGSVVLRGHVRTGREPLADAQVYVAALDEHGRTTSTNSARTAADGAYELRLPGPGSYRFQIHGNPKNLLSWSAVFDVPAVEAFEFDPTIPVGRISGRVTDAAGQPLVGMLVRTEPAGSEGGTSVTTGVLTAAGGEYELLVSPGLHDVIAGGDADGFWGREHPFGEARVALSVGENDHVRGVDFRLETGGILEGTVRFADGSSAGRAWVTVYGEDHPLHHGSCQGDRFQIGLAAGTYLVDAGGLRMAEEARSRSVEVEVVAGETRHVELELVPARRVNLRILRDGSPVACALEVRDARGKPEAVHGGADRAPWLLLPPGPYTLRARREGQELARSFEVLDGDGAQELELVFE